MKKNTTINQTDDGGNPTNDYAMLLFRTKKINFC